MRQTAEVCMSDPARVWIRHRMCTAPRTTALLTTLARAFSTLTKDRSWRTVNRRSLTIGRMLPVQPFAAISAPEQCRWFS
jgi:hypothetical protein